ncbi:hypothetical protein AAH971_00380 [Enterococcus faecalis]|uniref:hypothetical protein n=1 Tax=Enterococcus faecalis TaxID=1351 RepID=UPI0031CCEDB1
MDNASEKKYIYEQMHLIIEERRELTKLYFQLKERVSLLDKSINYKEIEKSNTLKVKREGNILNKESNYQQYILSKKSSNSIPYQKIALTISSILKGSGRPLSNKEIHTILTNKHQIQIGYKNLTMNILPKMHNDSTMNIERAYRGYWQYRLNS